MVFQIFSWYKSILINVGFHLNVEQHDADDFYKKNRNSVVISPCMLNAYALAFAITEKQISKFISNMKYLRGLVCCEVRLKYISNLKRPLVQLC